MEYKIKKITRLYNHCKFFMEKKVCQTQWRNADTWVDLYGDVLFRFVVLKVKDHRMAEDLVQETFLVALQSSNRFKGQSSVKTWFFAILKHKVIDYFGKNRSRLTGKDICKQIKASLCSQL